MEDIFLFMEANPSWDGLSMNVLFSKKFEKEARFKVDKLATFAYHLHGKAGLKFFNADMKNL